MYFCMTAKLSNNTVLFWKTDLFIFILCIWMFSVYLCLYTYTHAWYPWKPEKYHIPWNWSYRWMWITMWVLGIELKPSGRQPVLTNLWAIFPAPNFFLRVIHFYFTWMGIFLLFACLLYLCTTFTVPPKTKRGHWILWNWS